MFSVTSSIPIPAPNKNINTAVIKTFAAEGVILDWSALFMREVRKIEPQYAGYSFSLFYITVGNSRAEQCAKISDS